MKNASISEVEEAKRTGVLREDLMYAYEHGDMMVHGKRYKKCVSRIIDFYKEHMVNARLVVAEDADGELRLISVDYIRSPIKGPAQTPKKQRKPHVKGTKLERKIPFTADMRLKVGDKVLLSNGLRGVIGRVDTSDAPYYVEGYAWFHSNGKQLSWPDSITHIILPYEEPKNSVPKTKEQQDFEAGYWVPWIATKGSVCPKWAEDVPVETLWDDNCKMPVVNGLFWLWDNLHRHIVAYRKVQ